METSPQYLSVNLYAIARACRMGDYGNAANGLNKCIPLFLEMQLSMRAPGSKKNSIDKLNYSLETALLMLERKDWVALADVLEFEMIKLLRLSFADSI